MATPAAVLSIVVEAQTGKASAELQKFDRGLDDKTMKVIVNVDQGSVARAKRVTNSLGGDKKVKVEADVDMSSWARAQAVHAVMIKESNKLTDVLNRSRLSIGQRITALAALSPVALDAAGAIGALTASLGAATAGFGALAVGIGGVLTTAFGGIAAIAAPAISSLTDLMTAQEAANKAQTTGAAGAAQAAAANAQAVTAAHQQVADSTRSVTAAEEQLAAAQRSVQVAQESLTAAREEATRQLQDMRRAAMGADESEESARIALRRSEEELQRIRRDASSSNLDVRDAENQVALARNNVRDVTIAGNRAQEDYNRAQRGGISQMPGVVSAQESLNSAIAGVRDSQRGVAEAHRGVSRALQGLADAQRQANSATAAGGTSLAALALAQKKAGPAAVSLAHNLKDLGQRWRRLTTEGREDFFGMLGDGVDRLNEKLPLLARSANTSMGVLRSGFNQFLDRATGPEFDHFIHVMTRTFANSMPAVSRAFGNIAVVLERIAVAVAPDIVRMARGFEDMTEDWRHSTRDAGKLRDTVHELVGHTEAWWDLLVQAKDLIVATLVPGMGQGKKAVEDMTDQLKEWTDWVNAHPQEIRNFFKEALETTRRLAEVLLGFLPALFQISQAARPLARIFLGVLNSLNSLKIGNVSALTGLLAVVVGTKLIRGIMGITGAFRAMTTAALGASAASAQATSAGAMAAGPARAAQQGIAQAPFGAPLERSIRAQTSGIIPRLRTYFTGVGNRLGGAMAAGIAAQIAGAMVGGETGNRLATIGTAAAAGFAVAGPWGAAAGTVAGIILSEINSKGIGGQMAENIGEDFAPAMGRNVNRALANLDFSGARELRLEIGRLKDVFRALGNEVPPELRNLGKTTDRQVEQMKRAFDRWQHSIWETRHTVFRNLGEVEDKTRSTLRKINNMTGISSERREELEARTWHEHVRTIERAMNQGEIAHGAGMRAIRRTTRRILQAYHIDASKVMTSDDILVGGTNISHPGMGPNRKQRGGSIGGRGEGDKVPAMLEPGEFVVNKKATQAARPMLERLNREVPRFAKGGWVGDSPAGLNPAVKSIAQWAMNRFGASASDTVAPRAGPSFHPSGGAVDLVSGNMLAMAKGLVRNYQSKLEELIHTPLGYSISGGERVAAYAQEDHYDHVHIAALGKAIAGAMGGPKIKLPRFKAAAENFAPHAASLNLIAGATEQRIREEVRRSGMIGGDVGVGVKTGPVKQMARQMVNQIWGRSQWPPFVSLEMAEAGWNPRAVNPSSGAAGLAQALPPSKYPPGAWPYTGPKSAKLQLQWMMSYIQERYGDPAGAWAFHQANNYYKKGGMVAPFVGSFDKGGTVGQTGLGLLHKGEHVLSMQKGGVVGDELVRLPPWLQHFQRWVKNLNEDLRRVTLNLRTQLSEEQRDRLKKLKKIDPEDRTKKQKRELEHLRELTKTHDKLTKAEKRERVQLQRNLRDYGDSMKKMKTSFMDDGKLSKAEKDKLKAAREEHRANRDRLDLLNQQRRLHRREERREERIGRRQRELQQQKSMVDALKELRSEIKEQNRNYKTIKASEKIALNAMANLVNAQIGAKGLEQGRLAAAGSVARY